MTAVDVTVKIISHWWWQ